MINNLNFLILKFIFLKSFSKESKNKPNTFNLYKINDFYKLKSPTKLIKNKIFVKKNLPILSDNKKVLINNNNIFFSYIFYYIFYLFNNKISNKTKIFFFNYINLMIKSKSVYYRSLKHFYSDNELNFFKHFNKIYKNLILTNSKNYKFFQKLKKKKKEFVEPNSFFNHNNFYKKLSFIKKKYFFKNFSLSFLTINICFFKKCPKDFEKPSNNLNYNYKLFLIKNCNENTINISLHTESIFFKKYTFFINKYFKAKTHLKIKDKYKKINLHTLFSRKFKKFKKFKFFFNVSNVLKHNEKVNSYVKNYIFKKFTISFFFLINRFFLIKNISVNSDINKKNLNNFIKFSKASLYSLIFVSDFYNYNISNKNSFFFLKNNFLYNSYFLKSFKIVEKFIQLDTNFKFYNNYYPVLHFNKSLKRFLSKFKVNLNVNYLIYFNFYIISFLENLLKKNFFLKITNNKFHKTQKYNILFNIHSNYKNYQPKYMKRFLIIDFLETFWYSLYLKDLNIFSSWICKFLENTHFRFHRKFILFFQNFYNKHESIFSNNLGIKGFFFDIRGKVGVAGNSKKRHFFFKSGVLGKSKKTTKMAFKQSIVRTPSGALGLTFLINY